MKHIKTTNELFGFGKETKPDDIIGQKVISMIGSEKCEIIQDIKYYKIYFYVLFDTKNNEDISVVVKLGGEPIIYLIENDKVKKLDISLPISKEIYDLVWKQYYKQRKQKLGKQY
jgi:hypothetical protein